MASITGLRRNRKVAIIDDERDIGNGVIVTLKRGYTFDAMCDNRVAGADDANDADTLIKRATLFAGPYDD